MAARLRIRRTSRFYAKRKPKRVLKAVPGRNDIGQFAIRKDARPPVLTTTDHKSPFNPSPAFYPPAAKIEELEVRKHCISRAGIERDKHAPDRDGVCIFCDAEGLGGV